VGIANDMQGGAFVTWTVDPNSGVYLQHIGANGQVLWADTGRFVGLGGSAGNIASDGAGGALVLTAYVSPAHEIIDGVYRFAANGSQRWLGGVPFTVETAGEISLSHDGAQGAFVAMTKSGGRVNLQWIDSSGTVRCDSNGVALCTGATIPEQPRVTHAGPGKAIVSWNVHDSSTQTYSIVRAGEVLAGDVVDVPEEVRGVPTTVLLRQNYPNPFNPETVIDFTIPRHSRVKLVIFDLLGRRVETLVDGEKDAGSYQVHWKVSHPSSGVYFYTLQLDGFTTTKKMILLH